MAFFNWKKKEKKNFDDFPPIGGLMVSKMVSEEGKKPMFIYREKRTRPEDSGWRIFSGYESEEYAENPNNAGIYNPSTILKIDSSLESLLLSGVGSVFERKNVESNWERVYDFELDDDYISTHKLNDNWTISVNNLFELTKEDNNDLLYTTGDKSIRIAFWKLKNQVKNEIYSDHKLRIHERDQSKEETIKTYEFSDELVLRLGYQIKEKDNLKEYKVIYGFSIIDFEVLQLAFYFDNEEDEKWAIETWKNITPV